MDRRVLDVLLIECNEADIEVFKQALEAPPPLPGRLHVVEDGKEALDFLARKPPFERAPRPSLVIVNSRAPGLQESGLLDVITGLRVTQGVGVPILMIGATTSAADIKEVYRRYVSAYMVIPEDATSFRRIVRQVLEYWLTSVQLPHAQGDPTIDLPSGIRS